MSRAAVLRVDTKAGALVGRVREQQFRGVDERLLGLEELGEYVLRVDHPQAGELFVDDLPCPRVPGEHNAFLWKAGFFAGPVLATFIEADRSARRFRMVVAPDADKASEALYGQMIGEIAGFDATLLAGATPAQHGMTASHMPLKDRVQATLRFERLRHDGHGFLSATRYAVARAHRTLAVAYRQVPLERVRRLLPASLRDPRVLAATLPGHSALSDGEAHEPLVDTVATCVTADTAANATLKSLLLRFTAAVHRAESDVRHLGLQGERDEQEARRPYRLALLADLDDLARGLLADFPFSEVTHASVSSAGLTQIASLPTYARAYRLGARALRLGLAQGTPDDELPLPPSYGIYETWCFVAIAMQARAALGLAPWRQSSCAALSHSSPRPIAADIALVSELADGRELWLLFQPTFPSVRVAVPEHPATSLSGERRPDIVMLAKGPTTPFVLLDAKYRAAPQNVLDGMESAHVYRDSLRLLRRRAEHALILFPGQPCLPLLHERSTWTAEGIGAVARTRPDGDGIAATVDFLRETLGL